METEMRPRIKLIMEFIISKRDRYGNCYWLCRMTSTETGRAMLFRTDGHNVNCHLRPLGLDFEDRIEIESEIPIRQWGRLEKQAEFYDGAVDGTETIRARMVDLMNGGQR